ncbi:MAG: transcriptional regulator NrdR [Chloroflexi bacterium]|nr:transcriptional regulator NrdR [Chloroflexota bacterium]|tara:strand:- start:140134 stop:140649 length:516 start_codon:yes stop_codon:yes gene_type:complete
MNCPYCDNQESKVVDSRYIQDGIRRRRECLMCSLRFTTYEKVHTQLLNVTKRSNTKETFSVEKLTKSITTACKKRPISIEKIEKIAIDIETALLQNHGSEISSNLIGQMVLNELIKIDKVSYIRFSSVYRDFQNEDSFVDEIDKLKTENIINAKDQLEMFPQKKIIKKEKE